jgi:Pyruvate/2-oxoacid:ferredoxin oxidoreductase delta subunit
MRINRDLCNGCEKCVAECPKAAISKDNAGNFTIDAQLCDNCVNYFDIECIRICEPKAITQEDGTISEFDATWRIRSEHLIWLMAVMGSKGNGQFPVGHIHWDPFRKLIIAAYRNPDLKVRLTKNFDDNCIGCSAKQAAGHPEHCGELDDACFAKMGVEPGMIMRLWDAVQLVEDKFSILFIKELGSISDSVLENFLLFVAPNAKVLTNS